MLAQLRISDPNGPQPDSSVIRCLVCSRPRLRSTASLGRAVATVAMLALIARSCGGLPPAAAQQGPASVMVADVILQNVAPRQSFVGTAMATRRVVVGSAVDGRVLEFPVNRGEAVVAGQTLAELRTATIEIEIAGAKAELQLRMAELEELRNGARPEELQLAQAGVEAAEALREYSLAKLARAETLMTGGTGISQDEFEQTRAESLRALAVLSEATSQFDLVRAGPRQERIAQAAARVAVQEQEIAGLEDRLDKYTVKAPFDGFVVTEMTEAGAWLQQGMAVAEIVAIDPIEVEVYVPESNIAHVRVGRPVIVQADAWPDRPFPGEVVRIVPLADERARTFPVRVRIPNPMEDGHHEILPGMLAHVELPTGPSREMLMVHKDALQLGGEQTAVMKIVEGKAVSVPVTTGPSLESWIAVTPLGDATLTAGEAVIARGNERLRGGQPVKVTGKIQADRPVE